MTLPGDTGEDIGLAGTTSYLDLLTAGSEDALSFEVPDEDDPISLNYTSGTTGDPKGMVYTHRGAYLNALGQVIHQGFRDGSSYLWTLPMFHCNGWCTTWGHHGRRRRPRVPARGPRGRHLAADRGRRASPTWPGRRPCCR